MCWAGSLKGRITPPRALTALLQVQTAELRLAGLEEKGHCRFQAESSAYFSEVWCYIKIYSRTKPDMQSLEKLYQKLAFVIKKKKEF